MDDLHVTNGIDVAFDVNDVRLVEYTNHMEDAIARLDMREKGIAETLTFACAFDQTGDVHDLKMLGVSDQNGYQVRRYVEKRRLFAQRFVVMAEVIESSIRHGYST